MPIPSPEERPDLYDDYDGPPGGEPRKLNMDYWEARMPERANQRDTGGQPEQQQPPGR